jgi:hypothetical protein
VVFKNGIIVMAPDGNPKIHRTSIKTPMFEQTLVVVELFNFDQATSVCKELVEDEGIQALILCPGFTHEAVAKIAQSVGEDVTIDVARGDFPGTIMAAKRFEREGWLP